MQLFFLNLYTSTRDSCVSRVNHLHYQPKEYEHNPEVDGYEDGYYDYHSDNRWVGFLPDVSLSAMNLIISTKGSWEFFKIYFKQKWCSHITTTNLKVFYCDFMWSTNTESYLSSERKTIHVFCVYLVNGKWTEFT